MGLSIVTPACGLVVEVDDLKAQARIDGTAEDDLIEAHLRFAQHYVERQRGEQLLTACYRYDVPGPLPADCRVRDILGFAGDVAHYLPLPLPPLQAVTAIKYYDPAGTLQTLDPSVYRVVSGRRPGYLVFTAGLPAMANREDALQTTFTCGYGDPCDVPDHLQQAIRLLAADAYRAREAGTEGSREAINRLLALDRWR
jgi:hypothetical protein